MLSDGSENRRTPKELIRIHWKVGRPIWKEQLRLGRDLTSPILGECFGYLVKGLEGLGAIWPLRTLKSDLPGLPVKIVFLTGEKLLGVESELIGIGKRTCPDESRGEQSHGILESSHVFEHYTKTKLPYIHLILKFMKKNFT